jgi:glutamyl-tRNA reductase
MAVPRDVDPAVAQLPDVRCFDLDALQAHLATALAGRQQAVPEAEAIVAAETRAFLTWQQGQAVAPLLAELRLRAEAIRQAEVQKTLRHLPGLTPAEQAHVEALAEALVNKLLHAPTTRLRADATYAAAVRQLFALND